MKKLLAFGMLFAGLGLAAAAGSRNGESHNAYRVAQAELPGVLDEILAVEDESLALTVAEEGLMSQEDALEAEWQRTLEQHAQAEELAGSELVLPERPDPLADKRAELSERGDAIGARYDALTLKKAELEGALLPGPKQRLTEWFAVGGIGWLFGVGLIIAGAVLARRQIEAENRGEGDEQSGDVVDFLANLKEIRERLAKLQDDIVELKMDEDAPKAREDIDRTFDELIHPIVDSRGRFAARHGVGVFASYFGVFAGGERYLSRTWSALTDGHAVEARASLAQAVDAFAEAEAAWHEAEGA